MKPLRLAEYATLHGLHPETVRRACVRGEMSLDVYAGVVRASDIDAAAKLEEALR